MAAKADIFLEISARKGHSLANGHVAKMAQLTGAKLLLNSDAHEEADLLTPPLARQIARAAGLDEIEIDEILITNAQEFLKRLSQRGWT